MAKEICISSTPHETRLAILENDLLTEIYYERENEYTLAGSIYKGRVTRVLPGMQSAFVDLGLERDAFLYVTDFMEEQEDSADFERTPNGGGGSNGVRREGQAAKEGSAAREARESGRFSRTALSVEPESKSVARNDTPAASPADGEPGRGEDEVQGTRRWRGRRGRRRGGRPQGLREQGASGTRPDQPSAQHASSADQGFDDEVETGPVVYEEVASHGAGPASFSEGNSSPAVVANETIVLPGESLSRYGGKSAEAAPRQERGTTRQSTPAAPGGTYRPSTLVDVAPGWDGGAELPGESLSRHRGKSSGQTAAQTSAPAINETQNETPLPTTPEMVGRAWEVQPGEKAQSVEEHLLGEDAQSGNGASSIGSYPVEIDPERPVDNKVESQVAPERSEAQVELKTEAASFAEAPEPETAHHGACESAHASREHAHVTEYEPEFASASHHIDPAPPSEYRNAPVLEEEIFSESSEAPAPEEITAADYEDAAQAASPIIPAASIESDPLLEHTPNAAAVGIEEPSRVFEPSFEEEEFDDGEQGFAPGSGPVEEEVIEEEEYDSEPIRAYAEEHDLEDLEEETLDNLVGAELSEMVRDAHLEQRIGGSPDGIGEESESDVEFGEAESGSDDEDEEEVSGEEAQAAVSSPAPTRRDGRTGDNSRGRGTRRRGRPNGGGSRRANSQLSDLPIISELLKQGQEILVQIAKEPIAKKGARITSHIALPGRFLVFMPTVNHVGVSRKISSDEERQRLKRILNSEKGANPGGFIVRTAADGASEDDLRADIRFLISLWNDIKQHADEGKAPALIYHDLNLIERVLRDQVSANFATIWVDNEGEYERILRFLNRFEPSLVRRVKLYTKETPLFEQFGIQEEISKALKSKVWLKSGGSIVINQTEALVAIDINTGKYVGKTARLEDTILKTNLDAIPEIVRQIRLRDLGGIIVIDFIDMDERKNRHKVMAALEEELKTDRAPSKVLQFNDFGLVAITRKRVKQSLERTLSVQCEVCAGTGMVKSPTTVCNEIFTEVRKMQRHLERGDILLRVNPEVVKTLKANNARWLNELEELTGKTVIVKSDPALHPEQFDVQ